MGTDHERVHLFLEGIDMKANSVDNAFEVFSFQFHKIGLKRWEKKVCPVLWICISFLS